MIVLFRLVLFLLSYLAKWKRKILQLFVSPELYWSTKLRGLGTTEMDDL